MAGWVGRWAYSESATQSALAWVPVYWQALQQELALYWSSLEKLDQRAQILAGPGAPEQLHTARKRIREQLWALQEWAATR